MRIEGGVVFKEPITIELKLEIVERAHPLLWDQKVVPMRKAHGVPK
jgi:hypothetical protein